MQLSGNTIKKLLAEGKLVRNGQNLISQVGSCSLDVTLAHGFKYMLVPDGGVIELDGEVKYGDIEPIDDTGAVILRAHGFILGSTQEFLEVPNDIAARIDGRSTRARAGLVVQTAGVINPGMKGNITLEICNLADYPIILRPGQSVAQIEFFQLDESADEPYNGVYQGQTGTTGSRLSE